MLSIKLSIMIIILGIVLIMHSTSKPPHGRRNQMQSGNQVCWCAGQAVAHVRGGACRLASVQADRCVCVCVCVFVYCFNVQNIVCVCICTIRTTFYFCKQLFYCYFVVVFINLRKQSN